MWQLFSPVFESEASFSLKLYAGFLWFLSLNWSWMMLNLLFKELGKEAQGVTKLAHNTLTSLRKSKVFMAVMMTTFFLVCFGKTFVIWNHKELY